MVLGHGDRKRGPRSAQGLSGCIEHPREGVGACRGDSGSIGKWLNVKSIKVEKAIFQMRFAPHFSPLWASRPGCKSTVGGQNTRSPLRGPKRAPPAECTPPGGPSIDPEPS